MEKGIDLQVLIYRVITCLNARSMQWRVMHGESMNTCTIVVSIRQTTHLIELPLFAVHLADIKSSVINGCLFKIALFLPCSMLEA
jgi:hypothetical protein